jgi:type I restriction enzyme S subunit
MKAGWTQKRLGDFLQVQNGYAFDSKAFGVTGMPLIRIRDLKNGVTTETCFSGDFDPKYLVNAGDFLIGMDGEFGCYEWKGSASLLNQRVCRLQGFSTILAPRFLFYGINSHLKDIEDVTGYTTVKHISSRQILEILMPTPSLAEQNRIVAILDEAFDGIASAKANAEKNLQNARELFVSQREALLSSQNKWNEASLTELCDIKHGYAFEGEYFASKGDHVLLTPGSFFETGGYRERGEKTKYFVGPIPPAYILGRGDLLVAMTEQAAGLLGSPLLVPESNRFLHNQRLGLVIGKQGVPWLSEFFFHVFNLLRVRREIHSSASGVKVRHTSPGKIGAVRVKYPASIEEQRSVAAELDGLLEHCKRLGDLYKSKIVALDELKRNLLQRAFNGDL